MSIIYNNTEIENITYNGTALDTVNYNNTEVFSGTKTLTVNIGSYIDSIIINDTTYTSNTTVSIKPGTSVTLDCTPNSSYTSGSWSYVFSLKNWTGYTTETSKSFTFTMPNSNITYTANGNRTALNWSSEGNIPESTLLSGINNSIYNTNLVGRYVTLTEGSSTHNWIIIRVNSNSYDLWYNGKIGYAKWAGADTNRYWKNNSSTDTTYVRGMCTAYKSNLSSSIQAKLKISLNLNCSSDTVVILSARQLGFTTNILTASDSNSNTAIPYFNSNSRRNLGFYYWTSSARSDNNYFQFSVSNYGGSDSTQVTSPLAVTPAIRVG